MATAIATTAAPSSATSATMSATMSAATATAFATPSDRHRQRADYVSAHARHARPGSWVRQAVRHVINPARH
ncbi:hypothetical protein [Nonomuraea sp. SYSU D8015]|uniref:hypothetical protein n=1 Tax=Nonomuraea sp. SYSU D8015 TaxID=2593644 RepID=UPI001661443B|nr:hypothetical protein [Nonomuraea sp. SYSU D8015]